MTAPMNEASQQGEMPRGEMSQDKGGGVMTRGAAEGSSMGAAKMQTDDAQSAPSPEGDMPHGDMTTPGTAEFQPGSGSEMPRGAMEDTSSAYGGGPTAGGSGGDITAGAASGNDMPRGDMQHVTTAGPGSSAGNGDMPRGGMTESAQTAGTMFTGQAQGAQATPLAGMEITGSWRLIVSGVSLQGG